MKTYYAYYSAKAEARFGYGIYLNKKGKRIRVTCVDISRDPPYFWDDKEYVGIVYELVEDHFV